MDWHHAEQVVGRGKADGFALELEAHEQLYSEAAPELARLIASAGARGAAESYSRFNRAAMEAQVAFRRWMTRANAGAFLTSVFSAFAMGWTLAASGVPQIAELTYVTFILSTCAALAAALGATALYWLRHGKLLETWMGRRAEAETQRINYFTKIVTDGSKTSPNLALLALEYFRRYQLDVQRRFFFERARQHEMSATRTVAIGATGAGIATFFSILAIAADGPWQAVSSLSVFGAALGSFAIGREQMTQDRRNAERYDRTYAALNGLTSRLDDVREAVAKGQTGAAAEFSAAVNEHISNEHRQWLKEAEATKAAMARIEAALVPPENSRVTDVKPGAGPEGP